MPVHRWSLARAWPALAVAPPFVAAAWLGLAPGPIALPVAGVVVLVLALRWAGRVKRQGLLFERGPGPLSLALRSLAWLVVWATVGVGLVLVLAAAFALRGAGAPPVPPERADAIYELDAQVSTRPLPACGPGIRASRVLLERGAHPRLTPEGAYLWFDAATDDGRRQVHRMDRTTGEVVCWTCDEAGNNEWPAPSEGSRGVAFETDRHVTFREPLNREIHLAGGLGDRPNAPSVRLTLAPAADRRPVLGPGGQLLVWSRFEGGRCELVGAAIRSGHGGVLLGEPTRLAASGLSCVMPMAWSPDARSLLYARGNPFGPGTAVLLDPATGAERPLDAAAAPVGAGASADGGLVAVATTEAAGVLAELPPWLGFVLWPAATALHADRADVAGTGLRGGEPLASIDPLALGEVGAWGAPTGVTVAPDGTRLVLGQRRVTPRGVEERLLEIERDCGATGASSPPREAAGGRS